MLDRDLTAFAETLDGVCSLLTRGQYTPNDTSTAIFFNALAAYPLDLVSQAFAHHVKVSKFAPTPADLLGYIEASAEADGRLGAEEAWALVLPAMDENISVVWTPEVAEAWGIARHVMPDKVGARMAFKEAYGRILREARAQRRPVQWLLAEGFEPAGRISALKAAAAQGRHVDGCDGLLALPAPREEALLLLAGPKGAEGGTEAPAGAMSALQAFRDRMAAKAEEIPVSADAMERERTTRLRDEQVERVARYGLAHGIKTTAPAAPTPEPTHRRASTKALA